MSKEEPDGDGMNRADRRETASEARVATNGGTTPLDVILNSLGQPRRRFILYYLQDHEIATVEELSRQIVAHEQNVTPDVVADADRDRIASQLIHSHLPNLADATFIEYDPRSRTVRYREPPALLDTILRLLARLERDTPD